eukprot:965170-Heterocapsa_arctica.AAC.1
MLLHAAVCSISNRLACLPAMRANTNSRSSYASAHAPNGWMRPGNHNLRSRGGVSRHRPHMRLPGVSSRCKHTLKLEYKHSGENTTLTGVAYLTNQ